MFLNLFNGLSKDLGCFPSFLPLAALPAPVSAALAIARSATVLRTNKSLTAETPTAFCTWRAALTATL